ncbi:MAG: bifunctional (p)ppGpp synthetase/guanosine-3',5'-bis(diphosphate) 3'-pyrophosphohydrolase [Bacilli bacterium]|nr:bifunctional (p)ppGpp synthetase/guanosine-3',5'-bis(diphosphate) 3'-pyrophosphohydrolase [Bacilli bacterium]MDD4808420.1 bifunctional (p)ppGpp synthetase/guanosine-3',5'-bis(diphosphate) 3'-pyrophosphohydrolase [Bacilli bacterium]
MQEPNSTLTFDDLKDKLETYIGDTEELSLVTKAYMFAYEKHFGQKRLSGEDYITHPLNVAYILTGIYADVPTICAALLHDVMEDCDISEEEMKEKFGDEITLLVGGVTKLTRLSFVGDNESMIANHRKILVGLSEDVRVIIIKLADRLHNLRTLWVLPEKKQKLKAKETLDILTPIAHRLGMSQIKGELEDLSLRYYKPDVYFSIIEKLNQSKNERDNIVFEMKDKVSELLNAHGIKHEITGRAKSIYSIYKKLDNGRKFSDIYDLLALRVFVDTEQDCYQVLGIIHSKYRPIPKRFKDYIAMPKTNMYQSLHTTVFGLDGHLFEIQIRTYEMDRVAELGIASHWSYKEQNSNSKASMQSAMEQKLQFFRTIMELKNEEANDEEFVRQVKEDVFKDTIYVFTPKGDVVELAHGSTPIDFAYRVHSGVGDKMVGAIVNNVIVPFDHVLQDNDIVKINTNQNSFGPNREWINMAKTAQTKNKIRSFFNRIDKEGYLSKGEELLKEELRKRKVPINDFLTEYKDKILNELKYSKLDELYISLGNNKVSINQIMNIAYQLTATKEEIILNKTKAKEVDIPSIKNDIIVKGIDNVKINIALCCKPIPGDRILGYITKGYGITVHRMICPNIADLDERIIEVEWNDVITKKYPTNLLVYASNTKNILLDIISKTSNNEITVQSINSLNSSENFLYDITVLVDSKESLLKFMDDIKLIPNILSVERIIK